MSDKLSVLSRRGLCRSPRYFMSLVHAFFYLMSLGPCYSSIQMTGILHNMTKDHPTSQTPAIQPLLNISNCSNCLSQNEKHVQRDNLHSHSGTMIWPVFANVICTAKIEICMSRDVRTAHQVSFLLDDSFWVQHF